MNYCSYEEAVDLMRETHGAGSFIENCYLDLDPLQAANRFLLSEEFNAVKDIITNYKQIKDCIILDIGCGNGIASYAFASLGAYTIAADLDSSDSVGLGAAKKLAESLPSQKMTVLRTSAEELAIESNYADVVYVRQALHHFHSLEKGLKECARTLKKGGLLLATREHIADNQEQLNEFLKNHPLQPLHGGENAYPLEHYITALEGAGLKVIKIIAPFDSVINHYPIPNADIGKWLFEALSRKAGRNIGKLISKFNFIEQLYRKKLSKECIYPGRLYSFIARKI